MKPPVNIIVMTFNDNSDEPESERSINHSDSLHRQWLEKHLFWSVRNGRTITIEPVGESE